MAVIIDKEAEEILLSLSPEVRQAIRKEIKIFENNLKTEGGVLLSSIKKYVNERPNMARANLIDALESDLKNIAGRFGEFKAETFRQAKIISYRLQNEIYEASLESEMGLTKKHRWIWQAVFVKTCPSCIELHGTSKTMEEWDSFGHPKTAPTICNGHCQCVLMPTESIPSKEELRKPIMIENDRIRRTEIKRGRDYSPEYKSQIIGNLRNNEFRKTMQDLRKVKKIKS